jgi:hypothetical protein
MIATLQFDLAREDDEKLHGFALNGGQAIIQLRDIDRHCRRRIKDSELGDEARRELEQIRHMISYELLELLH